MSKFILRLIISLCALSSLSFCWLYIRSILVEIDGQGNSIFLIASFFFSAPLIFLNISSSSSSFRKVHLFLLIFYLYFVLRYGSHSMSSTELVSYIIGSTSGTALALALGFSVFTSIHYILELMPKGKLNIIFLLATLAFLFFNILILKNAFDSSLQDMRPDVFLIQNQDGYYQRATNYLIVGNISTLFLVVLALKNSLSRSNAIRCVILFSIVLFVLLSGFYSQLVGSNNGLFSTGLLGLVSISFAVSPRHHSFLSLRHITKSRASLLSSYGYEVAAFMMLLVILISIVSYLSWAGIIDFSIFRISGFGSGENSSFISRLEILTRNFNRHIFYNFIFGEPYVDIYTTGRGTYLHSLLSILSHLGIVGLTLFILFIRSLYLVFQGLYKLSSSQASSDYIRLSFVFLVIIFIVCFFFTFFTWFPFWFMIGFSIACCSRA